MIYVYGAVCTWHGGVDETKSMKLPADGPLKEMAQKAGIASGPPCCPHCGGMLMQMESKEAFDMGAMVHEYDHPGYCDLLAWLHETPTCYPTFVEAAVRYTIATGKSVTLTNHNTGKKIRFSPFCMEVVKP